ncbi:hypothetical protein [uncultured Tateyamaria sp.]|uniref:hypothetical protein n=1 Tax=uncultured Tateyamaria sp. TaxID=455651 RepID=UPI001D61692A|nr:hypothetical protein [uncultured Tateyamaria sp.]MCB4379679.1 hypothetical protein [Synechococcus sp. MU1644]
MTLRIHRQFIGTIAAVAIAITGFSAAPARAGDDEVGAALAALLGLAIVGAVIHEKKKDKKRRHTVHTPVHPKPLPKRVDRKLLPQKCLRSFNTDRGHRRIFGQRCLNNHYKFARSLPAACHREVYTDRGWRRGYAARCLNRHGYQLARR